MAKQWCRLIWYTLAANCSSGVYRIVELFKHPLHATTHPQFLVLELRATMGACPGKYGITILYTSIMVWSHHPIIPQTPLVCSMTTQCLFKAQSSSPPSCLSTVSQVISLRDKCSRRCTQHCTRCGKYWVGGNTTVVSVRLRSFHGMIVTSMSV